MIATHKVTDLPALGVHVSLDGLLHPHFRILLKRRQGIVFDDALFGAWSHPDSKRDQAIIPLDGELMLRAPEKERSLRPGEVVIEKRGRWGTRKENPHVYLFVEWDREYLNTPALDAGDCFRLSAREERRLQQAAVGLLPSSEHGMGDKYEVALEIFRILRAAGLPIPTDRDLVASDEPPPWAQRLGFCLEQTLTRLGTAPRLVDLELALGWSPSTIHRRLRAYQERYATDIQGGWRELLRSFRLSVAAALMTAPGATTEFVAAQLGYAQPTVMSEAFANAGLPSPGNIREVMLRL